MCDVMSTNYKRIEKKTGKKLQNKSLKSVDRKDNINFVFFFLNNT